MLTGQFNKAMVATIHVGGQPNRPWPYMVRKAVKSSLKKEFLKQVRRDSRTTLTDLY